MLRRRTARTSLRDFTLYTKPDYAPNWHHDVLCRYLDRMVSGEILRLMVFMPPRYGKSELVSRRLPAYVLGRDPDAKIIATSYGTPLASDMNRDVQRIIDDDHYTPLFPETYLSGQNIRDNTRGNYLRNSDIFEIVGRTGYYKGAGVGGAIMGKGYDFGIVDDPYQNRQQADSPVQREAIYQWYTSTFYTRRAPNARILLCSTRWNEDDLPGRLLKLAADDPTADQWIVLSFPALAEDTRHPEDPRKSGEALWPQRYSLEELRKTQAASPYDWASLYQQNPRPEGGTEWPDTFFGPGIWFDEWPQGMTIKTLALDPSKGKDAKWGDYSAIVRLGRDKAGILYCEADLARRNTERIVSDSIEHQRVFGADAFAVETNAFQELLAVQISQQSAALGMMVPVAPLVNTVNKQVRIRRLGPYLAAGNIRFKGGSPGTRLLVQQLRNFPLDAHDDGPDALEMALRAMIQRWNSRGQRPSDRLRP